MVVKVKLRGEKEELKGGRGDVTCTEKHGRVGAELGSKPKKAS